MEEAGEVAPLLVEFLEADRDGVAAEPEQDSTLLPVPPPEPFALSRCRSLPATGVVAGLSQMPFPGANCTWAAIKFVAGTTAKPSQLIQPIILDIITSIWTDFAPEASPK